KAQSTRTTWPAKPEFQTEEKPWRQRHSKGRVRRWSKRKRLPKAKRFARRESGQSGCCEMPAETRSPRPRVPREEAVSSTIRNRDRIPSSRASQFRNGDTSRKFAPDSRGFPRQVCRHFARHFSRHYSRHYSLD